MTQIATTMEQSQLLLNIGVSAEAADMRYSYHNTKVEAMRYELVAHKLVTRTNFQGNFDALAFGGESSEDVFNRVWGKDIPAWSLSALLSLLPRVLKSKEDGHHYMLTMRLADLTVFEYLGSKGETLWSVQQLDMFEAAIATIQWLIREKYQLNIPNE